MNFDKTMVTDLYDTLTEKVKTDLDAQYTMGRLTGSDYANVYAQLMGQCLQLAYQTPIQDKDIELKQTQKDEMIKNGQSDRALKQSQKETQDEQTLLVNAETAKTKYESDYLLPSQKTNYDNQALKAKAETEYIIPAQKAEIEAQTNKINKDIDVEERRTKIAEDQSAEDLLVKQQQIASNQAQEQVYIRQKQGFDDKLKMDLTKMQLDTWGMMFSSGLLSDKPAIISSDEVSTLYNNIKSQLGI